MSDKKILKQLMKKMKNKPNTWTFIYREMHIIYKKMWRKVFFWTVTSLILIDLILILLWTAFR